MWISLSDPDQIAAEVCQIKSDYLEWLTDPTRTVSGDQEWLTDPTRPSACDQRRIEMYVAILDSRARACLRTIDDRPRARAYAGWLRYDTEVFIREESQRVSDILGDSLECRAVRRLLCELGCRLEARCLHWEGQAISKVLPRDARAKRADNALGQLRLEAMDKRANDDAWEQFRPECCSLLLHAEADLHGHFRVDSNPAEPSAPRCGRPTPVSNPASSREEGLQAFLAAHPNATLADIKYSARVYTADFQDWRNNRLKDQSVMSVRIEDVLSGTTQLKKRPRKRRPE
jgi:hypothetical protein